MSARDIFGEARWRRAVDQLEPVDPQILVHAQADASAATCSSATAHLLESSVEPTKPRTTVGLIAYMMV